MVASLLLLAVPLAPAESQIAVDRLSMVFRLTPNEPRLGLITVRNEGASTLQAVITLADWDRAEDGANRFHPIGTVSGSCGSALQVFPPTVSLEPGASHAIRVTLDTTAQLNRECWAVAVVEKAEAPVESGSGVSYRIRTATKIYVQPPGLALRAEVHSLGVNAPAGTDSAPAVQLVVVNTGARHLEGKAVVQVRRPDNTIVQSIQLPTAYTLPGARSRVSAPFPTLPPGRYVLLAVVDYGGAELAAAQIEHVVP